MATVQGAVVLIIVTEWQAYRSLNWIALKVAMKAPVIFDGRNLFDPIALTVQRINTMVLGANPSQVPFSKANQIDSKWFDYFVFHKCILSERIRVAICLGTTSLSKLLYVTAK